MTFKRIAVFLAVAIATYFFLVIGGLLLAGGAVSCQSVCSDSQRWLNDAYPAPMIVGLMLSVGLGVAAAGRVSR